MDLDKIKKMIGDGFVLVLLKQKLQLTSEEYKEIKSYNFTIIKEEFSDDKLDHIMNLYIEGVSISNLSKKYSMPSTRKFTKIAKERGILRLYNNSSGWRDYDQNIFNFIDTPQKAYWLGFLYADGNVRNNTLALWLKGSDEQHIKKFADFLKITHNYIIKDEYKKKYPQVGLYIKSPNISDNLLKFGCPPRKSFILTYPEWLDKDLHSHFIRGYFEGDGCLTYGSKDIRRDWGWSLVGTKEMCEGIKNIIEKELNITTNISYISKTQNNTYNLQKAGNEVILKILEWLYKDAEENIRLDRKYKRYQELKEQQTNRVFSKKENAPKTYLITPEERVEILKDIDLNISIGKIAKKYGRARITIRNIKKSAGKYP